MYIVRSFIYVDYERTFFPRFFQTLMCLNSGKAIPLDDVCDVSNIKEKYLIQDVRKYKKTIVDWCGAKQKMIDQYSKNKNKNSGNIDTSHESDLLRIPKEVKHVIRDADQQIEVLFVEMQSYFKIKLSENPVLIHKLRDRLQSSTSTIEHLTEKLESLCQKTLSEHTEEDKSQSSNDKYNLTLLSDVW